MTAQNKRTGARDYDLEDDIVDNKWITLSGVGKLSASAKLASYLDDYNIKVNVIARTTDGTDLSGSASYIIAPLITELKIDGENEKKVTVSWINGETSVHYYPETWYGSKPRTQSTWTYYRYYVSSSAPDVASGYIEYDSRGYAYVQLVIGQKTGKATITVTAADGSNRSAPIKVTVKNSS